MGYETHEKLLKKIAGNNLSLAIFGKMIIAFSLGAIYSIQLVKYGYYILIVSAIIIISYLNTNFMNWYLEIKTSYTINIFGFAGGMLLLLLVGIQSPHVPLKSYLPVIGIILIIPALKDSRGKKRR